jgi:hypothetical protein
VEYVNRKPHTTAHFICKSFFSLLTYCKKVFFKNSSSPLHNPSSRHPFILCPNSIQLLSAIARLSINFSDYKNNHFGNFQTQPWSFVHNFFLVSSLLNLFYYLSNKTQTSSSVVSYMQQ